MEKEFVKYKERGSTHWQQMMSRDLRKFNADQQARYEWVVRMMGDIRGKKILDQGCGDGGLSYCLARRGANVVGIDTEPLGIEFAKNNLQSMGLDSHCEFLAVPGYELSFKDGSFDCVANSEVIEHVEFPERMVAEAYRVLKPGGKLIMTTPHRLTEIPKDPNHMREYFPSEIQKLLGNFSAVEIRLTHHIFWFGLYTYSFRAFSNRQFGKWFMNMLTLWFRFNPFLIEYPKPTKFDRFTQILAIATK